MPRLSAVGISRLQAGEDVKYPDYEVGGGMQDDATLNKIRKNTWLRSNGIDPTQGMQLELLLKRDETKRALPNDCARSSLFSARNKTAQRAMFKRAEMFHLHKDITVVYTGEELRAEDDELVWMQILHLGRSVPLGAPFEFEVGDLIRAIGWPRNGHYYEKARTCISRLKATEVMFRNAKAYGVSGAFSLIKSYTAVNDADGKPTRYRMWLDPEIIVLFAGGSFVAHQWLIYRKLSPVAKRLADYAKSHKEPMPLDVDAFKRLCGVCTVDARSWRQTVRKACTELVEGGVVVDAELHGKMIYLHRQNNLPAPDDKQHARQ